MRVLGVDPGYDRLGLAIVEQHNGTERLLFSECFSTSPNKPHEQRLADVHDHVHNVIKQYTPNALAIEALFLSTNKKTAMKVAESRGVVLSCVGEMLLPVFEYSPPEIKVAVTGHGRSDKKQVMAMIPHLVVCTKEIVYDDEYDAIAVALTHYATRRIL